MAAPGLVLPVVFQSLLEKPGTKWLLLKVEASLNWRTLLAKARLKLTPGEPPEVVKCSELVSTREIKDPWGHYVPLEPEGPDSTKWKSSSPLNMLLQLLRHSDDLERIDTEVAESRVKAAKAVKRKLSGLRSQRAVAEKQKMEAQRRFQLKPTNAALSSVGFFLEKGAGMQEKKSKKAKDATGEEEIFHLKPMAPEDSKGCMVSLAFWSSAPFTKEMQNQFAIKVDTKSAVVAARMQTLKGQQLIGTRLKKAKRSPGFRFILGLRSTDSRRIWLEEADVFRVDMRKKFNPNDVKDGKQVSYGAAKGLAVLELGTKQKRSQSKAMAAKLNREYKIVEFGAYRDELKKRAEELSARVVTNEEKDARLKAQLLPPYNAQASTPRDVYKEALLRIAPPADVAKEEALLDKDIVELLMSDTAKQLRAVSAREREAEVCLNKKGSDEVIARHALKSRLSSAVVKTRARGGLRCRDEESARALAIKIGILEKLVVLVAKGGAFKGGKSRADGVAQLLQFRTDSPLAVAWHADCYDDLLNKAKVRCFNGRKAFCTLLVWAINLTPDLATELQAAVERELGLAPGQLKKGLEFIGCSVVEDRQVASLDSSGGEPQKVLIAKLEGPPKMNEDFYHQRKKKKGSGKG